MASSLNEILKETIGASVRVFAIISLFGLAINLLTLTAPLFMMQVFNRVITSRNTDTLVLLVLIAGVALMTMTILEITRTFTLVRLNNWLDKRLAGVTLTSSIEVAKHMEKSPNVQALRDLGTFRMFLTGASIFPILDAPFAPIFLAIMFLLHPFLGAISLIGAFILFGLALLNEKATRDVSMEANGQSMAAMKHADATARNADVVDAMGMLPNLIAHWNKLNSKALALQAKASDRGGIIASTSKFVRVILQIATTATGAWLVIKGEMNPGAMIAGGMIMGRALAPVEQAIGSWKGFLGARAAYGRLKAQLEASPSRVDSMKLPEPKGELDVDSVAYTHPGSSDSVLRNITFNIEPGVLVGLIGPSASGKSTLARLLVGNIVPRFGNVRLDGMDIAMWAADDRGKYIGYLPQDVELFAGSIQQNIARMGEADPKMVIEAAQMAGVHEMILHMEKGYDTEIGEGGAALSGGQRQRIGFARAIFGNPKVLILDEPNANLDNDGDNALMNAMEKLRTAGMTIIIIAHRPSILRRADKILVLQEGQLAMFGDRDEVLAKLQGGTQASKSPLDYGKPKKPQMSKKATPNGEKDRS